MYEKLHQPIPSHSAASVGYSVPFFSLKTLGRSKAPDPRQSFVYKLLLEKKCIYKNIDRSKLNLFYSQNSKLKQLSMLKKNKISWILNDIVNFLLLWLDNAKPRAKYPDQASP